MSHQLVNAIYNFGCGLMQSRS